MVTHSLTSLTSHAGSLNPQKEQLSFDVLTEGLNKETADLVLHIKTVAESLLFHWKSFPIVLPQPVAVQNEHPSIAFHGPETQPLGRSFDRDPRTSEIHPDGTNDFPRESFSLSSDRVRPLILKDVFITPSFDELDAVAVNPKGDCQKLSPNHLNSIREKGAHLEVNGKRRRLNVYQLEMLQNHGEFEVESLHFPGQKHRWRVSECLQKGNERTYDTFLDDLAKAASLLLVTAKERIKGYNTFSLRESGTAAWNGILGILDLAFGIQWVQAHNLEARIKEERCSYLVQELTAKDGDVQELCSWILSQVKRATREKFHICGNKNQPHVPYFFTTPQGQELNLKLFNRELMKKMLPILVGILEKESRGWFLHFREKIISQLKAQGLGEAQVEKEGNKMVQEEYLRRVYSSILSNQTLQSLGKDVPQLLVDQAKAVLLMHLSLDEVERIYAEGERERMEDLKQTHSVLSRIPVWLEDNLNAMHEQLIQEHKWRPHEHAMALCKQQGLHQHAYFLQRDLAFMREREPVLLKELQNVQVATRVFEWRTQIWFPGNYLVNRSFQGETEVIPTVLALAPTSITTPRSDPNQPVYLLEKQVIWTTSTRWPFWRWFNFMHRSWTWTCNALFFFAVWLPLCSPVSLRALFSQDPFMADYELSQVNGTVCPSKASMTPTLSSRLTFLWRHISKSRTHFESMPDTGFIGKGVSRHINRLWNYLLKGIVGTLFLTTVFPIVCMVVSVGSLLLAVTAPIWGPTSVALTHVFFILVYDFDSPSGENKWFPLWRILLWNFLCLGIIQPLLAFAFAAFVCPLLAAIVVLFAFGRRGVRNVWDKVMFHGVIKKRGRIPSSNSILVRRIAGPGLHDDFVYQVSCEQALAAFEARLEMDELAAFEKEKEEIISEPLVSYGEFVHHCFGPFSGVMGRVGNFARIEKEVRDLTQTLYDKVEKRRKELTLGLESKVRSKIKMKATDLKIFLKQATLILEEFYPMRVLSKLVKTPSENSDDGGSGNSRNSELLEEINFLLRQGLSGKAAPQDREKKRLSSREEYSSLDAWWESRGLSPGDYCGLASLIITEIFSPEFLTPLEDSDTVFQMEVQGINLSRYTEMIRRMPERKDLDAKITIHTPRGNIKIHTPFLDLSCFTPIVRHSVPTQKTQKASLAARLSLRLNPGCRLAGASRVPEKLLIPPPVPHPAHISVIIHNRDASEQIPLEEELTRQVLRTIEDMPHVVPSGVSVLRLNLPGSGPSDESYTSSSPNLSLYDDPSVYSRPSVSGEGRRRTAGRSRTATLEMTETLQKITSLDSRKASKRTGSSGAESLPRRSSGWLSSPLRVLLEGQRPFSVALNLANAEDEEDQLETPEEGESSPHTHDTHFTYSHSEGTQDATTTAV